MIVRPSLILALLLAPAVPAHAASFDCAAAETPFETAICDTPDLSRADEILAKSFATALGGLTSEAQSDLRAGQRAWLAHAERACTADGVALTDGSYDERGISCLTTLFDNRSRALEQSRMINGHRFTIASVYDALPDPDEVDNPNSYWPLATHDVVYPVLDYDDPIAEAFNGFVVDVVRPYTDLPLDGGAGGELDESSDSSVTASVTHVAGTARITLELDYYWFGHGAAHGNYGIDHFHYLIGEGRLLEASDIFAGADWQTVLRDAAWSQLKRQHADWLYAEGPEDVAEIVIDPTRWGLDDDYGLIIQFQPYEVAPYAYGAPTISVSWESLEAISAESQGEIRYGY